MSDFLATHKVLVILVAWSIYFIPIDLCSWWRDLLWSGSMLIWSHINTTSQVCCIDYCLEFPSQHSVAVKNDLSDLVSQFDWAQQNPRGGWNCQECTALRNSEFLPFSPRRLYSVISHYIQFTVAHASLRISQANGKDVSLPAEQHQRNCRQQETQVSELSQRVSW